MHGDFGKEAERRDGFHQAGTAIVITPGCPATRADLSIAGDVEVGALPAARDARTEAERRVVCAAVGGDFKRRVSDFRRRAAAHPLRQRWRRNSERLGGEVVREPGHPVPCHTVHRREDTAEENPSIRLQRQAAESSVRAGAKCSGGFNHTVGAEPGDVTVCHATHGSEATADQNFSVSLHGNFIDAAVRASAGSEAGVQRAVGVEPGDAAARHAADRGELAADQNFSIRLHGQTVNVAVGQRIEGVRRFHRAVGIEPGEAIAGRAVDGSELSPNQNFSVGLQAEGVNDAVRTGAGRGECCVHRAIRVEPGNPPSRQSGHLTENTRDQNFPVRLHHRAVNRAVRARAEREGAGGFHRAVGIQPGEFAARLAVHGI